MNDQRAYLTSHSGSSSRSKRKDRESSFPTKRQPPPPPPPPPSRTTVIGSATMTSSSAAAGAAKVKDEMTSSNKLLAGYLAYEYLTKGTVLGNNKFDETAEKTSGNNTDEKYKEITSLFVMNSESEVRVPNVVNPTQLARWIEM